MAKKKSKKSVRTKWTDYWAKKELQRAKDWAYNIRLEGEEAPPMILLLVNTRQGREVVAIPIPEMILKGGGASISSFSRHLLSQAEPMGMEKPAYMILIIEAWMVRYREGTTHEQATGVRPSQHPERIEAIVALLSSPQFEIMATAAILGGIPQEWDEISGFGGRFSKMYGIDWGEA
ncbi:hypothetical protein CMI47_09530 [Candidatus Pacearchaeota archaeon]|nr:hypothetical protein [Candidatus Pacearchaeota archaeon]|tara:strand:+ start:21145 stop:21675 length:531 start_codon:yes stop_codon:yes gene_type:complete